MVCTPAGMPVAADGTVDHGTPLATTCSGLRTVSSGLANSDTFRPTIIANKKASRPMLIANGPTIDCKQLANGKPG